MKRLSVSIIIILFAATVAFAPVLVKQELLIYSFTEKSTEYTCDVNDVWQKTAVTKTGYFLMEMGSTSSTTMDVWRVDTFKARDPNGKMQKYAKPLAPAEYTIDYADIGTKETWIINLSSSNEHALLKGDEKRIKMQAFGKYVTIPTALTGTRNWYYTSGDSIMHTGSSTMSLRYHSRFTNDYYSDPDLFNAMHAVEFIIGPYLIDKGYIVIPLNL
jgi:hypothetical protein